MKLRKLSKKIRNIINKIMISVFFFSQISVPARPKRHSFIFSKSATIIHQNSNVMALRGGIQKDRAKFLLEELENIQNDLLEIEKKQNTLLDKIADSGAEKDRLVTEKHLLDSKIKLLENQLSSRSIFKAFIRELNEINIQIKHVNEAPESLKIVSIKDKEKARDLQQDKEKIMEKLDSISNEILAPDSNYFFGDL